MQFFFMSKQTKFQSYFLILQFTNYNIIHFYWKQHEVWSRVCIQTKHTAEKSHSQNSVSIIDAWISQPEKYPLRRIMKVAATNCQFMNYLQHLER